MKISYFITAIILTTTLFSCKSSDLPVKIHFENLQNAKFESGILTVKETGETYEMTSEKDFEIYLPKGKYHFSFKSNTNFTLSYPVKIRKGNEMVKITLGGLQNFPTENMATSKNIEYLIKTGKAKFMTFGIAVQDFEDFEKKYGIGLKTESCVISAGISKSATNNNLLLAIYLSNKYSDYWKQDLPFIPYGLENFN